LHAFINFNGALISADRMIINADNRGFKFGDGLFETIRIVDDTILLADHHFERLISSMKKLQFEVAHFPSAENLSEQILSLCKKNGHHNAARVRLVVFRGDGGLYDTENDLPNYIIQSWALSNKKFELNKNGLMTDVFYDGRKSCDNFSNIKTNNFLIYALASIHAKKNNLNDCMIINSYDRVCESTIANIFCIKDKIIHTPPLSEGCIAGIMRRFLLEKLGRSNFLLKETILSVENIKQADEVFLTNSIFGIRWVKRFGKIDFENTMTSEIFNDVFKD